MPTRDRAAYIAEKIVSILLDHGAEQSEIDWIEIERVVQIAVDNPTMTADQLRKRLLQ